MIRENTCVGNLPERFATVTILPLARKLLHQLVRNHQSGFAVVHIQARVVRRRPLAF